MIEGEKDREEPVTLDGKKEFSPHSFLYYKTFFEEWDGLKRAK